MRRKYNSIYVSNDARKTDEYNLESNYSALGKDTNMINQIFKNLQTEYDATKMSTEELKEAIEKKKKIKKIFSNELDKNKDYYYKLENQVYKRYKDIETNSYNNALLLDKITVLKYIVVFFVGLIIILLLYKFQKINYLIYKLIIIPYIIIFSLVIMYYVYNIFMLDNMEYGSLNGFS